MTQRQPPTCKRCARPGARTSQAARAALWRRLKLRDAVAAYQRAVATGAPFGEQLAAARDVLHLGGLAALREARRGLAASIDAKA